MSNVWEQYYDAVFNILKKFPSTRDSDAALYYRILEAAGHDPKTMTVADLLRLMHGRSVPDIDVIIRIRRKIQEDVKEMRGQTYESRRNFEIKTVTDVLTFGHKVTDSMVKTMNMIQKELSLEPIP